jgi:hypothetical protein
MGEMVDPCLGRSFCFSSELQWTELPNALRWSNVAVKKGCSLLEDMTLVNKRKLGNVFWKHALKVTLSV